MERIFLVFGGFKTLPTKVHETFLEAKAEAERLTAKQGQRFYVLESVGYAERVEQPTKWTDTTE